MKQTFCAIALLCLFASSGAAEREKKPAVAPHTYDVLSSAQSLMNKGQHSKAVEKLNALLPEVKGKVYEEALTYQMLGYAYSGVNEYKNAATAFRQALQSNGLPSDQRRDLTYNLAQILIHDEQYQEGLTYLEDWLKGERSPSHDARVLAAVAYYRSGNCSAAIPYLRGLADERKEGREKWRQALLGCYVDGKQYDSLAELLERLVREEPGNNDHWLQLAAAYQQSGQTDKAIAVMELMSQRGVLSKEQIINLARMYLSREVPYKAAQLLERKLADGGLERNREHLQLLLDCLLLAHEKMKAADVLQELLKISPDGDLYYRLGRIYFDLQKWPEAMAALQDALKNQGLKDAATANLLLGIAAVHADQNALAEQSLNQALRHKGTRDQAQWWLQRLHGPNTAEPESEQQG